MSSDTVTITISSSTDPTAQTPAVYVGQAASLTVTLTNMTGGAITFTQTSSSLEVYLPIYYNDVQAASVGDILLSGSALSGLTAAYNSTDISWTLTCNTASGITWPNNETLTFTVQQATTSAAPTSGSLVVDLNDLGGGDNNIPVSVEGTVVLVNAPTSTNADLSTAVQMGTLFGGAIFCSSEDNPLVNSIVLFLMNASAAEPLYQGTTPWSGSPQVTVNFVYGSTSGCLTQDSTMGQDNAWHISGAVTGNNDNGGWTIANPTNTGQGGDSPAWTLTPAATNTSILGTGANASVTFTFSNVVTFTDPGETQMILSFSGFMQSETTAYNDWVSPPLPITKLQSPASLGLVAFQSPPTVYTGGGNVNVPLSWVGFQIASIEITADPSSGQNPAPYKTSYTDPPALVFDDTIITVPNVNVSLDAPNVSVTFTNQAYSGPSQTGAELVSLQRTVPIEFAAALTFTGPSTPIACLTGDSPSVLLSWTYYNVGSVLITSAYSNAYMSPEYQANSIQQSDQATITVSNLPGGATPSVTFTLQAYDIYGNALNALTYEASFVQSDFAVAQITLDDRAQFAASEFTVLICSPDDTTAYMVASQFSTETGFSTNLLAYDAATGKFINSWAYGPQMPYVCYATATKDCLYFSGISGPDCGALAYFLLPFELMGYIDSSTLDPLPQQGFPILAAFTASRSGNAVVGIAASFGIEVVYPVTFEVTTPFSITTPFTINVGGGITGCFEPFANPVPVAVSSDGSYFAYWSGESTTGFLGTSTVSIVAWQDKSSTTVTLPSNPGSLVLMTVPQINQLYCIPLFEATCYVVDMATAKITNQVTCGSDCIRSITASPDGKYVFLLSNEKIWSISTAISPGSPPVVYGALPAAVSQALQGQPGLTVFTLAFNQADSGYPIAITVSNQILQVLVAMPLT